MKIYVADSRKDTVLREKDMTAEQFFTWLNETTRVIPYTWDAYKALPKAKQGEVKDVGGFIAGTLNGGRRRGSAVMSRSAVVIDADNIPCDKLDDFCKYVDAMHMQYCIYSTASHSPAAPRVRAVFPLSQDVDADMYQFFVRLLCWSLQPEMTWFDPASANPAQLMYLPAHCTDIPPVFYCRSDYYPLDVKMVLDRNPNWRDRSTWLTFPRETAAALPGSKQKDPTEKGGAVGAFCRVYDVPGAMAKYLPGVYEETATEGRYTLIGGSTTGGAILYDDGKFLYSHHATDPAGGQLVNAFDLVRLHRFGDLDGEAKLGTPTNRLPSYTAMLELAKEDPDVAHEMMQTGYFESCGTIADEAAAQQLAKYDGKPLDTECVRLVLRAMGLTARKNIITEELEYSGREWCSEDGAETRGLDYIMDVINRLGTTKTSVSSVESRLDTISLENLYNPVAEMLQSAPWDGVHRVPVLLEILGIAPGSFSDVLLQKWLVQCVAMAFNNRKQSVAAAGVLVLQGPQQIGKTTFFRRLAVNEDWFYDGASIDMSNKDSLIYATRAWITELGELDSTLRRDQASLKAFITTKVDRMRSAYSSVYAKKPRVTSLGGTVNGEQFLRDTTGDARFWTIQVSQIDVKRLNDLPDSFFVDLWHEVYAAWINAHDSFRLTPEQRAQLEQQNAVFRESLPGEEEIRNALDFDLPEDKWRECTTSQLRMLVPGIDRVTSNMIGAAVRKIAREDSRITIRRTERGMIYKMPLTSARFG